MQPQPFNWVSPYFREDKNFDFSLISHFQNEDFYFYSSNQIGLQSREHGYRTQKIPYFACPLAPNCYILTVVRTQKTKKEKTKKGKFHSQFFFFFF